LAAIFTQLFSKKMLFKFSLVMIQLL